MARGYGIREGSVKVGPPETFQKFRVLGPIFTDTHTTTKSREPMASECRGAKRPVDASAEDPPASQVPRKDDDDASVAASAAPSDSSDPSDSPDPSDSEVDPPRLGAESYLYAYAYIEDPVQRAVASSMACGMPVPRAALRAGDSDSGDSGDSESASDESKAAADEDGSSRGSSEQPDSVLPAQAMGSGKTT